MLSYSQLYDVATSNGTIIQLPSEATVLMTTPCLSALCRHSSPTADFIESFYLQFLLVTTSEASIWNFHNHIFSMLKLSRKIVLIGYFQRASPLKNVNHCLFLSFNINSNFTHRALQKVLSKTIGNWCKPQSSMTNKKLPSLGSLKSEVLTSVVCVVVWVPVMSSWSILKPSFPDILRSLWALKIFIVCLFIVYVCIWVYVYVPHSYRCPLRSEWFKYK